MSKSTALARADLTRDQLHDTLISITLIRLDRPNSRLAYKKALTDFFGWADTRPVTWGTVSAYREHLIETNLAASTVNIRLCAIRKMAESAWLDEWITREEYERVKRVANLKTQGTKIGTWLTQEQMQALLDAPLTHGRNALKCTRDRAILAVLMGSGVRREELCALTVSHFRRVKNCWTLADLLGKGNKARTIPIGDWCAEFVNAWLESAKSAAADSTFPLFPRINKGYGANVTAKRMTPQNVYKIVQTYGKTLGLDIAPHDLRRSFARLADESGAKLTQISLSLGHSDTKTTLTYLGGNQSFTESPGQSFTLKH